MSESATNPCSTTPDADVAQMAPTCEGCRSTSDPSASTADDLTEVAKAFSTMGAQSSTSAEPQSQPAHSALDDAALEEAWHDLGEPHEYEPPSERERQYLDDSRRRRQGTSMQRQRLHRNNMKYVRHSLARASVPPTDAEPSVLAAAAAAAIASSPAPPADADTPPCWQLRQPRFLLPPAWLRNDLLHGWTTPTRAR